MFLLGFRHYGYYWQRGISDQQFRIRVSTDQFFPWSLHIFDCHRAGKSDDGMNSIKQISDTNIIHTVSFLQWCFCRYWYDSSVILWIFLVN